MTTNTTMTNTTMPASSCSSPCLSDSTQLTWWTVDRLGAELHSWTRTGLLKTLAMRLSHQGHTLRLPGTARRHWMALAKADLITALQHCVPHSDLLKAAHEVKIEFFALPSDEPSTAAPSTAAASTVAQSLVAAVRAVVGDAPAVNREQVVEIATECAADLLAAERSSIIEEAQRVAPRTIDVVQQDLPPVNVGIQHRQFETLLRSVGARLPNGRRLNLWLYGPASTGKTSAAAAVAKALGLAFYLTGRVAQEFQLLGYTDAQGRLVRTPFRNAWENGGVFLLDEIDASDAQALTGLNAAIDGNVAAFPDGMVQRHPDFVMLAGANTAGRGATASYTGRAKQDVALLSRWVMLEWAHDDTLEDAIAGGDEHGQRAIKVVRAYRAAAEQERVDGVSTTTRSSLDLGALLRCGIAEDTAIDMTVRKGCPADTWARVQKVAMERLRSGT